MRVKELVCCVVMGVLLTGCIYLPGPSTEVVFFQDHFEEYAPMAEIVWSELPAQFNHKGHYPAVATADFGVSGSQSALLGSKKEDSSGNIGGYLYQQFPAQSKVAVTLWVWVPGTGRAFTLALGEVPADGNVGPGGGKTGVSLYFNNGTIQGYAGGWKSTGYAYPLSSWFQLRIEADTAVQEYRVLVRESAQEPWREFDPIPFRNEVAAIEFISIVNYYSGGSLEFYVDDVMILSCEGSN